MEHRHHRQDGVARRAVQGVGEGGGVGVQKRRAVAVEHAFGIARSTGGIAQRRCAVLIEGWPHEVIGVRFDQIFVAQQIGDRGNRRHMRSVRHENEAGDGRDFASDGFDQRQEGEIEEEDAVLGVVGDPFHLVRMQAWVQRVEHGTRAGYGVVQLHVAVAIPGKRGDAVTKADAERSECIGQTTRTLPEVAIGLSVDITFDAAGDDLLVAMMALGMGEERRDKQRLLLHQSIHVGHLLIIVHVKYLGA
ncbi:hypothetical protein D3C81_1274900 [compost metagenome]